MGKKLLKKLMYALIVCAAVFAAASLPGLKKTVRAEVEYEITDGHAKITGFSGLFFSTDVVIPAKIEGYSVTEIGNYAFSGGSVFTSISIPSSVTEIGNGAFDGCSGLTSIKVDPKNSVYTSGNNANAIIEKKTGKLVAGCKNTVIPSSVTKIGDYAFYGCSGLTSISIPNGVTVIRDNAFDGCSGLTSISIPSSVTEIGEWAFDGCSGLTSIKVDPKNSVYTSGNNANAIIEKKTGILVTGCKNTVIPSSVTKIRSGAFGDCSGLTSINIPSSVTEIGLEAFSGCSGLTSIKVDPKNSVYTSGNNANAIIEKKTGRLEVGCKNTVIPSSVTEIGYEAFDGCSGLTSISIPSSVTEIGCYAFMDCSGLTSISIPSSVTEIEWGAFRDCSSLKSISIPSSVTEIESFAFYGCDKLTAYVDSIARVKEVKSMIDNDKVKVLCRQAISATVSRTTLLIGEKATISAKGNKTPLKYVSSNPAVATVDANGNITALAAGKVTITINAIAKGYYASAKKTIVIDVNNMKMINKVWYYVKNGKADLSYTGMAKNQYGWWYIKNGKLDRIYTGMAKNASGWWYIKNGKLDRTYTGMAKNKYGWWYMTNGKLNTKYTGIATNKYGKWKFVNGKLVGKVK